MLVVCKIFNLLFFNVYSAVEQCEKCGNIIDLYMLNPVPLWISPLILLSIPIFYAAFFAS